MVELSQGERKAYSIALHSSRVRISADFEPRGEPDALLDFKITLKSEAASISFKYLSISFTNLLFCFIFLASADSDNKTRTAHHCTGFDFVYIKGYRQSFPSKVRVSSGAISYMPSGEASSEMHRQLSNVLDKSTNTFKGRSFKFLMRNMVSSQEYSMP